MNDEQKLDRFFMLILGICLVFIGAFIHFDPVFYSRKYGVQFNLGEHHKLIGFAISVFGGYILYSILTVKK